MMAEKTLIEAMLKPEFYPHKPPTVELFETHISYIFLAGNYVFKMKKAVDFGFLDFSTLEKRLYYCQQELKLNKRLAPEVYLAVLPISRDEGGHFLLGEGRESIEYVVKMKRLPEERMLKRLLAEGKADLALMEAIARKIADFHSQAETRPEIAEMGRREIIRHNHEENFLQTIPFLDITITRLKYDFIKAYAYQFLENHQSLFASRILKHKIRDCHGDLHLDHICILEEVVIFDCLEFNERFRYEDVAAEVAFLAMDLDYNNYADFGDAFVKAYIRNSRDQDVATLLNFYKCYYAYVRGKVISFRVREQDVQAQDRGVALSDAARYFDLAFTYAAHLEKPALIITVGLMGTGKTVLAEALARRLGAEIIRSDVLRKEMLHLAPASRQHDAFGQGIYTEEISRQIYREALQRASALIRGGKTVIIDASYKKRRERKAVRDQAWRLGANFFVLECLCPEEIVKVRLRERQEDKGEASDGRWELFRAQKADFDEVTEFTAENHLPLDTTADPEVYLDRALRFLKGLAAKDQ